MSFSSVSSDFVKLYHRNINETSDVYSTVSIDGYFNDSIYRCYKLFVSDLKIYGNDGRLGLRVNVSGSPVTTGTYTTTINEAYSNSSNTVGQTYRNDATGTSFLMFSWASPQNAPARVSNWEITLHNPTNTTGNKVATWISGIATDDGWVVTNTGFGLNSGTSALTGVTFTGRGYYIWNGNFTLYGIKK